MYSYESFQGTLVIRKPLGVRLHKTTFRVTNVEPNAAAQGEIFVGDKIVALDGKAMKDARELYGHLKNTSPTVTVRIEHGAFSWCKYTGTTTEMLHLDKDIVKATGRAIDVIKVGLSCLLSHTTDDSSDMLEPTIPAGYGRLEGRLPPDGGPIRCP